MYTNEILAALIQKVADALNETATDTVSLRFDRVGGEWCWGCYVEVVRKRHGLGHKIVRGPVVGHGDTPEAAVGEVLRKIAIPGYLEIV